MNTQQAPQIAMIALEDSEAGIGYINLGIAGDEHIRSAKVTRDPEQFLHLVKTEKPQVVLIDLQINGRFETGLKAVADVRLSAPSVKILVYTAHATPRNFVSAIDNGADSFLDKEDPSTTLLDEIIGVAQGRPRFPPELMREVCRLINPTDIPDELIPSLYANMLKRPTRREVQVLRLIMEGKTNPEIGKDLFVSTDTVKTHIDNMFDRYGVHERGMLVKFCKERFPDIFSSGE